MLPLDLIPVDAVVESLECRLCTGGVHWDALVRNKEPGLFHEPRVSLQKYTGRLYPDGLRVQSPDGLRPRLFWHVASGTVRSLDRPQTLGCVTHLLWTNVVEEAFQRDRGLGSRSE